MDGEDPDSSGNTEEQNSPSYKRVVASVAAVVGAAAAVWGFIGLPTPWEIVDDIFSAEVAALSIDIEPNPDRQIAPPISTYVIPRPITRIAPPPAAREQGSRSPAAEHCGGRYEWAHAMGAADFLESNAEVTLTGNSATSVVVTGEVDVKRRPSFDGPILSCLGGGSGLAPLTICVDLVRERLSNCTQGTDRKKPFARQLTTGEAEVLHLLAAAHPPIAEVQGSEGVYEWTVDLDVSVNGEHRHYVVDDEGRPFRTYVTDHYEKIDRDSYIWHDGHWQRPSG